MVWPLIVLSWTSSESGSSRRRIPAQQDGHGIDAEFVDCAETQRRSHTNRSGETRCALEAARVCGDECPVGGDRGRGDDQIVRTSWPSTPLRVGQQICVRRGDHRGVVLDAEGPRDAVDVDGAGGLAFAARQLDADQKFGQRDGGDGNVIFVADLFGQRRGRPAFCRHEDRGIEDQSFHARSCAGIERRSASSPAQSASGWAARSNSRTACPFPPAGSSRATTRPCRRITNDSPSCSTASSRSEKFLEASVAETSRIDIRVSDIGVESYSSGHRRRPV